MDVGTGRDENKRYKQYLDMRNSKEYQLLQQFYHKKTIFDILGVARQENPHSSFISWILDPYENHGMGDFAFKRFVETLCFAYIHHGARYLNEENPTFLDYPEEKRDAVRNALLFFGNPEHDPNKAQLLESLKRGDYHINSCEIMREKVLTDQRRADLYIDVTITETGGYDPKRLLIFIENKVTSTEHEKQTNAYMDHMLEKSAKIFRFILPIYLYPVSNPELDEVAFLMGGGQTANGQKPKTVLCSNRLFLLLNYQFFVDGVLSPCQRAFQGEKICDTLTEYISCLGKSLDDDAVSGVRPAAVMAVGEDEKKWSRKLWEDYQAVLEDAAEELTEEKRPETLEIVRNETDAQFYRTVLSSVLSQTDPQTEDQKTVELLKGAVDVSKRGHYYVRQRDGTIWGFASGRRGRETLGALAYVLVRQYISRHPEVTAVELREKLRREINHGWLFSILVTRDELKKMLMEWLDAYLKDTARTPVCPRFYISEQSGYNEAIGTWDACVVSTVKGNSIRESGSSDCPLSALSNQELYAWYKGKDHPCACFYDFVHAFFVGGIKEKVEAQGWKKDGVDTSVIFRVEPILKSRVNQSFDALEWDNDFAYFARWWDKQYLDKLIDVLHMRDYVSREPTKKTKMLDFMI